MIKDNIKNINLYFSFIQGILVTWTQGSRFPLKGHSLHLLLCILKDFFFLPPALDRGRTVLSGLLNPVAHKHTNTLTEIGTCTQITLIFHTKELNDKYYEDFLPRNIKQNWYVKRNSVLASLSCKVFSFLPYSRNP